jgi:hypothetical protein
VVALPCRATIGLRQIRHGASREASASAGGEMDAITAPLADHTAQLQREAWLSFSKPQNMAFASSIFEGVH